MVDTTVGFYHKRVHTAVRMDRKTGKGGGVITFTQRGIQYREINRGGDLEYLTMEVWSDGGNVKTTNFYNPFRVLGIGQREEMPWCGKLSGVETLMPTAHYGETGMMVMGG